MAERKPRAGKKLLLATSFAIALIGGTTAWRNYINADPQVVIPPYPTAPKPNGFDVYVKAAKMIVQTPPYVDYPSDPNSPTDPKVRAQQYSLANKEAWLRRNAAGFALMQTALDLKCLAPSSRADAPFPSYASLRELARCKSIERHACEMRGDWNGAVQSQLDTVQMGNDMAHGGNLISGLVAIAIEAIGRNDPWENVEHLNMAQARAAAKRLEAIYNRRITYAEVLKEDKWVTLSELKPLFSDSDSSWRDASKMLNNPSFIDRVKVFCVSKRAIANSTIQRLDARIANAQLPNTAPQKPLPPGDPISEMMSPDLSKARAGFARGDAGNALWMTTLALRAYKLEHNVYPTKLQELVPNDLKQVPADPFGGGEALRYKRAGNSYVLWSIGPDGVDNGGTPVQDNRKPISGQASRLPQVGLDSKGDFVAGKNR